MPKDPWESEIKSDNGWTEYKRLVINELERTNRRLEMVDKRLATIEKNIVILQTNAAMWSAGIALVISGSMGFLLKIL